MDALKKANQKANKKDRREVMCTIRSEFAKKGYSRCEWKKNLTPAEQEVLQKYKKKSHRRGALGGLVGVSAMAGIWKLAALSTGLGVTGIIAGGVIGAGVSMHTGKIHKKMIAEVLMLPGEKSPIAAEVREILRTKLPDNTFAQELLALAKAPETVGETFKNK